MAEADTGCDLYAYGKCNKSEYKKLCAKCRSDESWFTDKLQRCSIGEVCRRSSIFGNTYFKLTSDDVEALKRGEVLFDLDEYGTFIMLERED